MYNIPKDILVKLIVKSADDSKIREYFSVKDETNILLRLNSFSIAELEEFINMQSAEFVKLFKDYSDEFPLRSAPTLYILNITKSISPDFLTERSNLLALSLRSEALVFQNTRPIRAIYTRGPMRYLDIQQVYELILGYEKRVEFVECDPNSLNYAETRIEYSLENALFWYPKDGSSYAVIACCDFSAVAPLILYLNRKYNIEASVPNFSETMLRDLTNGSKVRNATFSLELNADSENEIDVNSITVYDNNLSNTKIYSRMKDQKGRIQRSGFYVDHPNLLRAGLGISCKYGRLWTPAHLDRSELISLAIGSINKLDVQLKQAADNKLYDFCNFFANKEVKIDSTRIFGSARKMFDNLIYYLALSQKSNNQEISISREFQKQLALHYKKLRFESYIVGYCTNCGKVEIHCPICGYPVGFQIKNERAEIICNGCGNNIDNNEIHCDCGDLIPIIDLYSNIEYLPKPELLEAVSLYSDNLHPKILLPLLFKIEGVSLLTLPKKANTSARIISLSDLRFWSVRAHYNSINTISSSAKKYVKNATEKCNVNNFHPRTSDCVKCAKKKISQHDFESNAICLLRTFGIPIEIIFDGIHHGHEFADLVYTDTFDDQEHKIAIHVKSHCKNTPPNGLGRSNNRIKGLYAQILYTLFELHKNKKNVDTIGIAIPNRISENVVVSIQTIVLRLGYSFIVIQESDWEKITQAAIDTVRF